MDKYVINPAWLRASHLVVLSIPGGPTAEEQIAQDRKARADALRSLPKPIRRQYARPSRR